MDNAKTASPRPAPGSRRAVFVDRDGTLNPDLKYLDDPQRIELFRGVATGLRWLRAHGYLLICITNQSGIDRGLYTAAAVDAIHRRLNERLASSGAAIDAFYYCPHAPDRGCLCRKPGTALFERARDEWGIRFDGSAIVGDRVLDVEAGHRLGLLTAMVLSPGHVEEAERELGESGVSPEIRALSFDGAVARILTRG